MKNIKEKKNRLWSDIFVKEKKEKKKDGGANRKHICQLLLLWQGTFNFYNNDMPDLSVWISQIISLGCWHSKYVCWPILHQIWSQILFIYRHFKHYFHRPRISTNFTHTHEMLSKIVDQLICFLWLTNPLWVI